MTPDQLRTQARDIIARILDGEKQTGRAIMAERDGVMAILRAVAGGGLYDSATTRTPWRDLEPIGSALVIGGGDE